MSALDGPRLAPRAGRPAAGLVVLLHGYGADGSDLLPLAEHWATGFPGLAFVAVNAPEPCDLTALGRQWFPLSPSRDPQDYRRGVAGALPGLNAFLDAELARLGLTDDRLVLAGFSQGAMLALHAGFSRPRPPAAVVAFSGLLADPGVVSARDPARPVPAVALVHGSADEIVSPEWMEVAAAKLDAAGIAHTRHLCPGLGHAIDDAGIAVGREMLARAFPA